MRIIRLVSSTILAMVFVIVGLVLTHQAGQANTLSQSQPDANPMGRFGGSVVGVYSGSQAPDASTVISNQLSAGDELIHGLVFYQNYLWGSTRYTYVGMPVPARIVKIDPSTLTVVDRVDLNSGQTDGEDIIGAGDYLWTVLFTDPAQLIRIDPSSNPLTYTEAITFSGVGYATAIDYAFGYLWVGLQDHIAQIDISDPLNPTYELHDFSALAVDVSVIVNSLSHDETHLWASFYQCDAATPDLSCFTADTIVKSDPITPTGSYSSTTVSALFPDDMAFVGKHLYVASELIVVSDLYQFSSDVSTYTSTQVYTSPSYGSFENPLDPLSTWSAFVASPGTLINFDLDLNKQVTLTLPNSYNNPAELAFDDFGNMYVTTWQVPTGIIKYSAPVSITVGITQTGSDVVLDWDHTDADVITYQVWRSTQPYFEPGDAGAVMVAELTSPFDPNVVYTDTGALGDVDTNYFYGVVAKNQYNLLSPLGNRVGEFDFELRDTIKTDFNWISLPFTDTIPMASDLKQHIEEHSSSAITVFTIEQWSPIAQSYQTFTSVPFPLGDFSLQPGGVYRVSVDISGGSSTVWSLSGKVPDPSVYTYTIAETAKTDFNWLMLPLNRESDSMASELKDDLDVNCAPSATFFTIEQWSPVAQSFQTFTSVPFPLGDFAIQIGYTYRISVDVTSGTACVWP